MAKKQAAKTSTKKNVNYSELPVYLFHQGTNFRSYDFLGCHLQTEKGKKGAMFRVWAPNAKEVSVVGDFNGWDTLANPMTRIENSGIWEVFIPSIKNYDVYKYALKTQASGGGYEYKADPFAFHAETPPENASKVYSLDGYNWIATAYEEERLSSDHHKKPMSIYELNLMSWRRHPDGNYLSYRQLADELIPYVKEMGYTHVEMMPITEYPFDGSWGYQVTGYFAVTSRLGTPHDFMYLVDRLHLAGIGVILDWVPAHFPKDAFGLANFDGTCLYEDANPLRREHKGWGTLVFDFGKTEIQSFLVSSAMFLFEKYHIDGIRVDAVASMLYLDYDRGDGQWQKNNFGTNINLESVAFLKKLNKAVKESYPYAMMIAEESTAFPKVTWPVEDGGLGFDYKWNMGWMNDTLRYMNLDPVYRSHHHDQLVFSMVYAFSEKYVLPISHDEVVHGKGSLINKMPGDTNAKIAGLKAFMGYMMSHPGKKLMFMGQEYGQFAEWNYSTGLDFSLLDDPKHMAIQRFFRDLNNYYKTHPSLYFYENSWEGFEWLVVDDSSHNVISYERRGQGETTLVVVNFSGSYHYGYRIGVGGKKYRLGLSSDDLKYGGSTQTGEWIFTPEDVPSNNRERSISVNLPPLSFMYLELMDD